jgi:hypothetical protein
VARQADGAQAIWERIKRVKTVEKDEAAVND